MNSISRRASSNQVVQDNQNPQSNSVPHENIWESLVRTASEFVANFGMKCNGRAEGVEDQEPEQFPTDHDVIPVSDQSEKVSNRASLPPRKVSNSYTRQLQRSDALEKILKESEETSRPNQTTRISGRQKKDEQSGGKVSGSPQNSNRKVNERLKTLQFEREQRIKMLQEQNKNIMARLAREGERQEDSKMKTTSSGTTVDESNFQQSGTIKGLEFKQKRSNSIRKDSMRSFGLPNISAINSDYKQQSLYEGGSPVTEADFPDLDPNELLNQGKKRRM